MKHKKIFLLGLLLLLIIISSYIIYLKHQSTTKSTTKYTVEFKVSIKTSKDNTNYTIFIPVPVKSCLHCNYEVENESKPIDIMNELEITEGDATFSIVLLNQSYYLKINSNEDVTIHAYKRSKTIGENWFYRLSSAKVVLESNSTCECTWGQCQIAWVGLIIGSNSTITMNYFTMVSSSDPYGSRGNVIEAKNVTIKEGWQKVEFNWGPWIADKFPRIEWGKIFLLGLLLLLIISSCIIYVKHRLTTKINQ